jgi:hypothetical protein
VVHVIQWAVARPPTRPRPNLPPLSRLVGDLAGGRDPWTRALLATTIVAVTFAALAPFPSQIGDLLGHIVPG